MSNKIKAGKDEFWISPYERIIGVVDEEHEVAQVYEYNARGVCWGATAWVAYHYPRTSTLVENAVSDGIRSIFTLKLGKGKLDLKPSISPAGIESTELIDDDLVVTYTGLAGGGVGISRCRALAKNLKGVEIIAAGGGSKLGRAIFTIPKMLKIHIGIDDTDTAESGATWSLANEIGWHASRKSGVEYLNHTIVQLYPLAPGRTKNCVSTAITFGVRPNRKKALIKFVRDQLTGNTLSEDTGMVVFEGIRIPRKLKKYSEQCRNGVVTFQEAEKLAETLEVEMIEITGQKGLIGALAALGYAEQHKKAVTLPKLNLK
jgi:methanogenesis imperfect marker protein 11